jgi:hypothetical protein
VVKAALPQGWHERPQSFDTVVMPAKGDAEVASVIVAGPSASSTVDVSYALEGVATAKPLTVRIVVKPGGNPLPQ